MRRSVSGSIRNEYDYPQILQQEANERNKLRELRERHSELEKIERSIVEVRDMFLRISTLVMEQVWYVAIDSSVESSELNRILVIFVESDDLTRGISCGSGHIEYR